MSDTIIYLITNKVNNKKYVGKTSISLERRFKAHTLNQGSKLLYAAIKKYGENNFSIEQIDFAIATSDANNKEIYWIKELQTRADLHQHGYNLTAGGDGGNGIVFSLEECQKRSNRMRGARNVMFNKHHTAESRSKISKSNKGKSRNKGIDNPMFGKKHSPEAIEKFKQRVGVHNPFFGRKHTAEAIAKMRKPKRMR